MVKCILSQHLKRGSLWNGLPSFPCHRFSRCKSSRGHMEKKLGRIGVLADRCCDSIILRQLEYIFGNDMEIPVDNDVFYEGSRIFLPLVLTQYTPCQNVILWLEKNNISTCLPSELMSNVCNFLFCFITSWWSYPSICEAELHLQLGDVAFTASSARITSFGWARVSRVPLQDNKNWTFSQLGDR